jgi:UDP-N-acetylglucosamine 2-epimerase (non-hydrolysing)
MKIVSIVGTRPNFIKLGALVDEIQKHKEIEHVLVHTGQHYDEGMSKLFFQDLGLPEPDKHLVIEEKLSGDGQTKYLKKLIKAELEMEETIPDLVIVVGDVNSTVAGAEAAHELGIKVAHVEAGLRSFDKSMPEEINRIRTDEISDFLFTTEESGNKNLLNERISEDKIFFVGNTMIDTLMKHRLKALKSKILEKLNLEKGNYCVLTLHRPSNVDDKMSFENIISILEKIQAKIKVVFPIHPRTRKNIDLLHMEKRIKDMKNLMLITPLGYFDFLCLMDSSKFVLTDSGGIQEETTVLRLPCVTMRNTTERPVTVEEGTNMLVSTDKNKILKVCDKLIIENSVKGKIPELWDGKAAGRIVDIILRKLN